MLQSKTNYLAAYKTIRKNILAIPAVEDHRDISQPTDFYSFFIIYVQI